MKNTMNCLSTVSKSLLVGAGLSLVASLATAGTITAFTDRATFEGQYPSVTLEDFGNTTAFPITSGVLNSSTNEAGLVPGDIVAGVTYSTEIGTGNFFNIDCCASVGGTDQFLDSVVGDNNLTVTFDSLQSGFGFDTTQFMSEFEITINFFGGGNFVGNYTGTGFYGFSSDAQDISSAVINGTGGGFPFAMDNFTFTDLPDAAVPLPAGLPLLLCTLGGLGIAARRRKTR